MKKTLSTLAAMLLTVAAAAQTLNVTMGDVTYQFPASQTGDMTYSDGTTLTIMGKAFTISDITSMTVDESSSVTDFQVGVAYSTTSDAQVTIPGNVAKFVTATVDGNTVTLTQSSDYAGTDYNGTADEITYQLSGESSNGSLTLGGSYKCTVSLAGVTLTNPSGAAINITNSKRIQLSAKKNTTNTLTDGSGSQKACIYSKGQLQLQGNGTLNVVGNYKHGIKSASYIEIKNLTLNITSTVSDGINCEEYLLMKSGTVTISGTGDDGIQCDLGGTTSTGETTDHEDEDTGNIYIEGGTLTVTGTATAAKCVKAEGDLYLTGGTQTINANGAIDLTDTSDPSYTAGFKADGSVVLQGATATVNVNGAAGRGVGATTFTSTSGTLTVTNKGALSSNNSSSGYFCTAKGIKAGVVNINGGTIGVTMTGAASKGIKADSGDGDGNMFITDGTVTVTTNGAGAIDYTESDGKGCAGLSSDNNITISGGTITLTSSGTGGKGLKADNVLTVTGGTINATASGSNYSSGSYSASAKAIKAGTKTKVESEAKASSLAKVNAGGGGGGGWSGGGGGGNQPGGGGGNQPGGDDSGNYTYSGGMVISGGTIKAIASSHEAIESKNTIDISGDNTIVYAQSSDDAINSASTFNISGGYVMGYSTGNDGLDANGDFKISGGNVFAIGVNSPEVGIDANTEGGYKLYITGGNVIAIGGLESGSSLTGVSSKSTSVSSNTWYTFKNGSTSVFSFKTPSSLKTTSITIVASSTPTISSGSISGTTIWNGYGIK